MSSSKVMTYFDFLGQSIGAEFFLAGGAVRDDHLGLPVKDFDLIARKLPVDDLIAALKPHGSVEKLGERFEVVAFHPAHFGGRFEIALPRTETSTDKGTNGFKAVLDPDLPIEDDLRRRDFTINSMAVNVHTREVLDPYNAKLDLANGVIKILHPASFTDDPLRLLRMLRFVAKLGFEVVRSTAEAARAAAPLLGDRDEVPAERIKDELIEILRQPFAAKAFRLARDLGLLEHFLPELAACVGVEQNQYHSYDVWEHTMQVLENIETNDWEVVLAALFHDKGKKPTKWVGLDGVAHFYWADKDEDYLIPPEIEGNHEDVGADMTRERMRELKFSTDQIDRVSGFVREHMFGQDIRMSRPAARRFLKRLNELPGDLEANVRAMFAIRYADAKGGKVYSKANQKELNETLEVNQRFERIVLEELANKNAMTVKDLDITGHTLMALGFEGAMIGQLQRDMLEWIMDVPEMNKVEHLVAFARATGGATKPDCVVMKYIEDEA